MTTKQVNQGDFKNFVIGNSLQAIINNLDASKYDNKKIFITGGTGFFGLWLLSALKIINDNGANLKAVVLSRDPSKFLKNNPLWLKLNWLGFEQGDIKNFTFSPGSFDYLIHAATDTARKAHENPLEIFSDVVDGSRRALDFAVKAGIKRVLITSSGAVYGQQPSGMDRIPDSSLLACPTMRASSAYGEGKRVMEFLASAYYERYGIESVSARCFAFVGPGLPLNEHFAIGNFIRDALYSDIVRIKGDGTAVRSYLYGADLAVWLLKMLVSAETCSTYNVGSDQFLNMRELAELVVETISPGKIVVTESQPALKNDLRSVYVPSIDRARNELALDVWTKLPAAIERTAHYYSQD
jgi:nucleoside-diphosphate-sugar epimerase